jgi:molybdopterin adenylyltransferase
MKVDGRLQGQLLHVCVADERGPKTEVDVVRVRTGHGIVGDVHAGPGIRQISALAGESIEGVRVKLPDLDVGAFGENLITEGIDWKAVPVGQRLRLGDEVLAQVSQLGKVCHTRCRIYYDTGDCIMPSEGVFLIARTSGELEAGAPITSEPDLDRARYAVVTVSDRSSAGEREDGGGPAIDETVTASMDALRVDYRIVPDEREIIGQTLTELCDEQLIDVVFTTGGTGLAPRDVTPEATADVIDREVPGMAEAIRAVGMAKTPHAMLSRGICGQRGRTLVINLSGSPRAVREQLGAILPALPHALEVVSGTPLDCACACRP